jgi:hypothetical protein
MINYEDTSYCFYTKEQLDEFDKAKPPVSFTLYFDDT